MTTTSFQVPEADIIQWRRRIHANPELSFNEVATSAFVAETLADLPKIEVTRPTRTSVVGVLRGSRSGSTVGLRADMDALPVRRRRAWSSLPATTGSCTPAVTTRTPRCCSEPHQSSLAWPTASPGR